MNNAVVMTDAPDVDYLHNYVRLPYYYGTDKYFNRKDVKAIRETVYKNLDELDSYTEFKKKFANRRILFKPNLVAVTYKAGYELDEIPQTTDPRVFEAIISYFSNLSKDIVIIESAGKGTSTMGAFEVAGYDKVSKYYNTELVALEEEPLDHYYVPKAEVQKEVYLPRILSEVVRGESLYVSCPKMKTNLYTGVTLGFKNAMGTLPGNMRYRNHSWQINKKLVDLLYLFKPDLTIIDGIIGGEGHTPAPVDPVKVGMIVSGTNSVETDRVATKVMGFDPAEIELMAEAKAKGFGDPECKIYGNMRIVPFRRAESTCLSDRFLKNWPDIRYFVGHTNDRAPKFDSLDQVDLEGVRKIESSCTGGCLATISMFIEMVNKSKTRENMAFGIVLGNGTDIDGKKYWFDSNAKAYTLEDIEKINIKKVAIGNCTSEAFGVCDYCGGGCSNVGEIITLMQKTSGAALPQIAKDSFGVAGMFTSMIFKSLRQRKTIKQGEIVDISFDALDDGIFSIPKLSEDEMKKSWILVPHKQLSKEEIKKNLKECKLIAMG